MSFTDNCPVCGITNSVKLDSDFFSEIEIKTFIDNIFSGSISVYNLDVALHLKMSLQMADNIMSGFGQGNTAKQQELLFKLVQSGYIFNAAKQYQLVRQIIDVNGNFDEALKIFKKINIEYFEAELDSAKYQGKAAKEWTEFVEWNNENGEA